MPADWQRAFERWRTTQPPGSVAMALGLDVGHEGEPSQTVQTSRIWIAGPSRWRHEVDVPGRGVAVKVVDGPLWWSYAPGLQAISNESAPASYPAQADESPAPEILDPQKLVEGLSVIDTHPDTYLGRAVDVVRAAADGDPHPLLARGADAHELVIDREAGIVLRLSASLDGREFSTVEVTELEVDPPPFADELFRIDLPPGMIFTAPRLPRLSRGPRLRLGFQRPPQALRLSFQRPPQAWTYSESSARHRWPAALAAVAAGVVGLLVIVLSLTR